MFVLCNDVNYEDYARWGRSPKLSGADFPVENIVSNGSTSQTGLAADLDAFVKATGGAPTDLVVVEADYLFHPQFNLQVRAAPGRSGSSVGRLSRCHIRPNKPQSPIGPQRCAWRPRGLARARSSS